MSNESMTARDKREGPSRPYPAYRFTLVVNNVTLGHFKSCSGLKHEIEVLEFQEGGVNEFKHKLIGQGSYPNITLKMGFVSNGAAEDWHYELAAEARRGKRTTVSIVHLNTDGSEINRWDFISAWPVKWEGPEFDASADNIAVETLEIAHHGLLGLEGAGPPNAGLGGSSGPGLPGGAGASLPFPIDPAAAAKDALDRARRAVRNALPF